MITRGNHKLMPRADRFLDIHSCTRVGEKGSRNLNCPTFTNKNSLPTKKITGTDGFYSKCFQVLSIRKITSLTLGNREYREKENMSKISEVGATLTNTT